jgi:hypothetical protein
MKPAANVVFIMAGILLALQAPASGQGCMPNTYMEALRRAEADAPALPADVASGIPSEESRAVLRRASSRLQRLAVARAFVGDADGAISAYDLQELGSGVRGSGKLDDLKAIEDGTVQDAIQAIVAAARTRRVVLINEAHHVSMHRAFAHRLATELRKIGYTYLAAETFNELGEGRKMQGYVNETFGKFTQDPVYADIVNQAMADGWKIISYEHTTYGMTGTPRKNRRS